MGLYALGDLHLHYESELKADSQIRGRAWRNHEERFLKNCRKVLGDDDTIVLVGDHSWGRKLDECGRDLEFISALSGRKILTRGNHDMFWDAGKTKRLNELYRPRLNFLQDGYETYKEYCLVATKGFTFEGPFYLDSLGRIIGWDEEAEERAKKLVKRELSRLRKSFEKARSDGHDKFIMFLHYPPTNILEERSCFTDIAEEYGVRHVVYAHCHGESRFHDSIHGFCRGITYHLVSGDFLNWRPKKILD